MILSLQKILNAPYLGLILTISLQFKSSPIYSQLPTMSSMGSLVNTSSLSASIYFKSSNNCIEIQSGIAVLNTQKASGVFEVKCNVVQAFNTLGLHMFPNPTNAIATIKLTHAPSRDEIFTISITNSNGEFIKSFNSNGIQLTQGLPINLNAISPGVYVLNITSTQYIEAVKFIKTN